MQITFDSKNRVYKNRKGELKKIKIGIIMHNPNYLGRHKDTKRKPFFYGNANNLTSDALRIIANKCDEIEEDHNNFS